jgi:phosphonate transport system substrate-binding protein
MLSPSRDRMLRRSAALLAVLAALAAPAAARAEPVFQSSGNGRLLVGLIPEVNIFKQKARFRLLGEYLGRKVGVPVQLTILSRYGNILESFEAQRMDGAFFGSFTGALAIERLGAIPIARPVNLDGASTYHGRIFVRKDSGLRTVADLQQKRMAFVDRATTAGYVFPLAWLREHGVPSPEAWFAECYFTGSHDAAVDAVLDRKADVGAAKHSVYDRLRRENARIDKELLVLAESPPVPSNGLLVRADLDPHLKEGLRRALLDLERDPEGAHVLAEFGALRFVETTAEDYAPVRELAARAGIDLRKYQYRNQ